MTRIFHGVLPTLERAFREDLIMWIRLRLIILCAFALNVMVSSGIARSLPSTIRAHEVGDPAARSESAARVSEQESRASEPQAQPAPRPLTSGPSLGNPPQVLFEDGQLTIIAENSSLSDILSELHARTGADIDLPASAASYTVWVRLGPGPPSKILAQLLSNTGLDYVIQGSDDDTNAIRSIQLTERIKNISDDGPGKSAEHAPRGTNRRLPLVSPNEAEVPSQENPVAAEIPTSSETAPATQPAASMDQQAATPAVNPPSGLADDTSKTAPRKTEEMIQQLQSMYQQRRQQMQQANRSPGSN